MKGGQTPSRTDCRFRLHGRTVRFRRPASWRSALLALALISAMVGCCKSVALGTVSATEQLQPTVGSDGYSVAPGRPVATVDAPTNEAAISLEPQALPLTTRLGDEPTAASTGGHQEASLQLLPESLAPSSPPDSLDGRRRRRLGKKRKRRPLQDDYWPPVVSPEDNDTESTGGGRLSERKRLPYAGAAASRWEGIHRQPSSAATTHSRQPHSGHQQHHAHRANDWMHNPYTDAGNVELQPGPGARRPAGGNFPPIDPNRPRRIPSVRATEPASTAVPAAPGGASNPKAYRKPYSQARRSEEQFSVTDGSGEAASTAGSGKPPGSSATDLKALLKQSDGLSLSEILQQRNISLQDLIKGKQLALAALTQSPLDVSTSAAEQLDATTVSPTLASVRFQLHDDGFTGAPDAPADTGTMLTARTITTPPATAADLSSSAPEVSVSPAHQRAEEAIVAEDETDNSVDHIGGVPPDAAIFPTVEAKQLALSPVLPIFKEERLRPIKGVASRIRPDLSNTHIRTSEPSRSPGVAGASGASRRLPAATSFSTARDAPGSTGLGDDGGTVAPVASAPSGGSTAPPNPTVASLLLITSTARERWTPSATLVGQRHREQKWQTGTLPANHASKSTKLAAPQPSRSSLSSAIAEGSDDATTTTLEPPTAKELVSRLSSAESTSILPEAEAMVELSPERHHHHLLRVPKLKTRIAIKPRLANVGPPVATRVTASTAPAATKQTTSTASPKVTDADRFNLSDVELGDDAPTGPQTANRNDGSQPRRQQRLNDDEPELNIIEKFTSFAEPSASASLDDKPASSEAKDDQEVADLVGRISEHTQRSFTDSLEDFYRDVTESNPSLFNDLAPIASSDDRRELLELMEDRRIGSRLAKVLSQRNMTLEQLLEHRRRGSSQLHLAEIVNGKVKPIDDKIDIVTAFEHFPRFNIGNLRSIRPDDIKLDSQGFSYFTSIINIRPSEDVYKEARALQARHRVETRRGQPPAATSNHRNEAHFLVPGGSKDRLLVPSRMSAALRPHDSNSNDHHDDTEHDGSDARHSVVEHDLLDMELSGHGFQHHRSASVTIESTSIPVGVRSAIVASSAIVGVSLAIFVAIFVACRLRQRRRQKLNYTENFNMAKGRLPIIHSAEMEARNSTSSSAPSGRSSSVGEQVVYTTHRALGGAGSTSSTSGMGATSGRAQQSALMDPNSADVQDYLWDRKPFQ